MVGRLNAPRSSHATAASSERPTVVAKTTIRPSWKGCVMETAAVVLAGAIHL
jgi:hypothetical protein